MTQLELPALFGAEGEKITGPLTLTGRAERLQQAGWQALRLARLLEATLNQSPPLVPEQQASLRLGLAHLTKIIADEIKVVVLNLADPDDIHLTERPHGDKGAYRIGATADPDADLSPPPQPARRHSRLQPHRSRHRRLLRETQVDIDAQPDTVALPEVPQSQFDHHGFFPKQVAGDMAYGYGKTRHRVAEVTGGQTQVIALVPDYDH